MAILRKENYQLREEKKMLSYCHKSCINLINLKRLKRHKTQDTRHKTKINKQKNKNKRRIHQAEK